MEKLQINHIAPYLPYGLKCQIDLGQNEIIVTDSWGLKTGSDYPASYYNEGKRYGLMLSQIKPLLHPLSDLYKEIDGKVGIVDLAKISADFKWKLGRFYCDGEYIDVAECRYGVFLYNKSNRVFELCNIYGLCGVAPNQLDLFTYLFQHHYDVFSLIDKGLAIDLNSISHE